MHPQRTLSVSSNQLYRLSTLTQIKSLKNVMYFGTSPRGGGGILPEVRGTLSSLFVSKEHAWHLHY